MDRKSIFATMLLLLLTSTLTAALDVELAHAIGAIYIRRDGSVDPATAPIQRNENIYTLTDNIFCDADGIIIERNNIIFNGAGYSLIGSGDGTGITLSRRENVAVRAVEIESFDRGVYLHGSFNCSISKNNITGSYPSGLELDYSSFNIIYENNVTSSFSGFDLRSSSNNIVSGNTMKNNQYGLELSSSSNNIVSGNTITGNGETGLDLYNSSSNGIYQNTIENNSYGLLLLSSCSNNTLKDNSFTDNSAYGLYFYSSSNNIVSGNSIIGSQGGLYLNNSSRNSMYHNNFFDDVEQAGLCVSLNVWDDGYPSGGNYWSDYSGVDLSSGPYQNSTGSDGIGDLPYVVDSDNIDHYPLMQSWAPIQTIVSAAISINPDTLSSRSKGRWIAIYIELPKGYKASHIDATTVLLNGTITPVLDPKYTWSNDLNRYLVDFNKNGVLERMCKFDIVTVKAWIYYVQEIPYGYITLTLTGKLFCGAQFRGAATIFLNYA